MVSDAVPSANALIAMALMDSTGLPVDQFRSVIIVYETEADKVGAISFACCPEHTVKLLGLSVAVVVDDPAAPFGKPCPG